MNRYTGSQLLYDNKKQDAHYEYYLHGPLARLELGDQYGKVQGIDYAYTLQGWLKGVNGQQLNPQTDMGADGYTGHSDNGSIARDAYGYALGYYRGDYRPIGGTTYTAFNLPYQNQTGDITGQNLYNGNISNSTLAISALNSGAPAGYTYHYDQLNRLKNTRQHNGISGTSWNRNSITANYAEDLSYDANGNIQTVNRNSNAGNMDNLFYRYSMDANGYTSSNRLNAVTDIASDGAYTDDLKNQTDATNYHYDAIGNLIHDTQSGIDSINWTVYGKIQSIYKTTGGISYTYNPAGQRISKTAGNKTTWYVRDAQGNTLALYDSLTIAGSSTMWREQHLYGSSRLGIWTPNINANQGNSITVWDTLGRKYYELNNHLGNVLATLTDRRVQQDNGNAASPDYLADVATAQDYYPFGSLMPGRQYTANGVNYRYSFNGKEDDKDITGGGQDYGARIYDKRLGRFLSVDPIAKQYPELTPYQFGSNSPIQNIDLDGLEGAWNGAWLLKQGYETLKNWWNSESVASNVIVVGTGTRLGMLPTTYKEKEKNGTAVIMLMAFSLDNAKSEMYTKAIASSVTDKVPEVTKPAVTTTNQQATAINNGNTEAAESNTTALNPLQTGPYKILKAQNAKSGFSMDHIPSFGSLKRTEEQRLGRSLTALEESTLKENSLTLAIKTKMHMKTSETFGGRNTAVRQKADSQNPLEAIRSNVNAYRPELLKQGYSNKDIDLVIQDLSVPFKSIVPLK